MCAIISERKQKERSRKIKSNYLLPKRNGFGLSDWINVSTNFCTIRWLRIKMVAFVWCWSMTCIKMELNWLKNLFERCMGHRRRLTSKMLQVIRQPHRKMNQNTDFTWTRVAQEKDLWDALKLFPGPGPPRMIWFVAVDTRGFLLAINLHQIAINQSHPLLIKRKGTTTCLFYPGIDQEPNPNFVIYLVTSATIPELRQTESSES